MPGAPLNLARSVNTSLERRYRLDSMIHERSISVSRRTDAELVSAAREIGYELMQCAAAVQHLRRGKAGDDRVVHNALVESVVLHVRSLTEFLVRETRRWPTDIAPTDFTTSGGAWHASPEDSVERLRQAATKGHKYLAHLTWERAGGPPEDDGWRFEQLVKHDLMAVFTSWLQHVERTEPSAAADELRRQWWPAWYFLNGPLDHST